MDRGAVPDTLDVHGQVRRAVERHLPAARKVLSVEQIAPRQARRAGVRRNRASLRFR
jgi:hypothetical protein